MTSRLPFDLTDLDNFAHGFPHEVFAVHRRESPVYAPRALGVPEVDTEQPAHGPPASPGPPAAG